MSFKAFGHVYILYMCKKRMHTNKTYCNDVYKLMPLWRIVNTATSLSLSQHSPPPPSLAYWKFFQSVFCYHRHHVNTCKWNQNKNRWNVLITSFVDRTFKLSAVYFQGPSYEEIVNTRQQNLSPSMLTFYKKPLLVHQGHMQWLFTHDGTRYLDLFGGIVTVSVGHCHP